MKAMFDANQVKTLLTAVPANAEIMLVGDDGVYLMSFAQDKTKRTIVYAEGCDPKKDGDDWYENKVRLFGGDDGGDKIGTAGDLLDMYKDGEVEKFFVSITPSSFGAGVTLAPDLKAFAEWQLGILNKCRALDLLSLRSQLLIHRAKMTSGTAKEKKTSGHLIPMIESVIKEKESAAAKAVATVKAPARALWEIWRDFTSGTTKSWRMKTPIGTLAFKTKKLALLSRALYEKQKLEREVSEKKTEPCASCKNGKQFINTTIDGKVMPPVEIDCIICNGKSVVPLGYNAKRKAAEESFWCKCGRSDDEAAIFHDDGECGACQKHHYHCGNCNKIAQVG